MQSAVNLDDTKNKDNSFCSGRKIPYGIRVTSAPKLSTGQKA
jgi:hypothetical protein